MDLIADTTLLVGLWRGQEWARRFGRDHARATLGLPWVVLGEFRHGARRAGHEEGLVAGFLNIGIPLINPEPVIPVYAEVCARLQGEPGWREIGQNDLWIGACALAWGKPLVTRNRRHFGRFPGLSLQVLDEAA